MPDPPTPRRYRFGAYEADTVTGELRRQGIRIKLNAQPFEVLTLLLANAGDLLTREQIAQHLWPGGTFVDFDHGVNSAINRIREALGDTAASPRFIETLARRGYRFLGPVELLAEVPADPIAPPLPLTTDQVPLASAPALVSQPATCNVQPATPLTLLATPEDLPPAPHRTVQTLFLLLQLMYLAFYVGALANLPEIEDLLAPLPHPTAALTLLTVTAGLMIPVRAFLCCAVLFHAPRIREQFLKLLPLLLALDELWSLAPFLLLHHINFGMALACTALLVYSPFAQRSLILMGAGHRQHPSLTSVP
jgi:cholera toxin transcriptional activator